MSHPLFRVLGAGACLCLAASRLAAQSPTPTDFDKRFGVKPTPSPGAIFAATPAPAPRVAVPAPNTTATAPRPGVPATAATAPNTAVDKKWKLVWSDEFNGTSLDLTKWQFEVNGKGGGNGELQYYTDRPANLSVHDGKMVITAAKEQYQGPDGKKQYTSARITSQHKASWCYGRFEARIKMPKGKGLWPAFWMMPEDSVYGTWASSGEIDISEVIGDKDNVTHGTLHYGGKWPKNIHTGDKYTLPSGDFSDDFHVFAVEWQEGEIRWYLDGTLFETQTQWKTDAAPFPAPFNQKFYFIFNVAVGGAWPGKPDASTVFPQTMEVDYVRAYQLVNPPPPAAPTPAVAPVSNPPKT